MATQLQIRRGTSTQVAAFTGAEGEIVVNTTNDSVHVNDGSTAGGFELARADLNNVSDTDLNAALTGNTVSALTITTLTLGATAITATGAELNILDGVTSTAAELNILDGVTSTTAELNILDGVTATTAELNYVDGVTSAIQTQIDTKAPLASPTFTGTATMGGLEIATSASDIGVDLKLDGNKTSNGAIGSIIFENNGDSVGMIRSNRASANDAADMLFYTQATGGANTERMRIDSSGNLLVGHTGQLSASKFLVSFNGYSHNGYVARTTYTSLNSNFAVFLNSSNAVAGTITHNGTTTVNYSSSSDQRLKENIVDAPSASADIDAIQVRSFDWKAGGEHEKYGFIAQELNSIAPTAVSEMGMPNEEDPMLGVDSSKLVPMLVKEIQSLRARVAQLENN